MTNEALSELELGLSKLTVFRDLLKDPIIIALRRYLKSIDDPKIRFAGSKYSAFINALYEANGGDLTGYVTSCVFNSENIYIRTIGKGETPKDFIKDCVKNELSVLSTVASLTKDDLTEALTKSEFIPDFYSEKCDLSDTYFNRAENIGRYGYGMYAANHMFYVDGDGVIIPVKNPDKTGLSELVDYELQRNRIIENTRALLCGKPAANILLTGDAGTGKSSTIKAVVNELYKEGLRIIEIRKDQLSIIPKILDELAENPLKFILFIDDLSFLSDDDDFNGLKAVLEGSVSARSKNVVVYATSNRRHIVRERFSDREGDDIHRNDAMQEMISLSDRFGLHITFGKPDKKTYLNIVKRLAEQFDIGMAEDELDLLAERFALERGGRSARLARQFIDSILSKQ